MASAGVSAMGGSVARRRVVRSGRGLAPAGLGALALFVVLAYGLSWAWMLPFAAIGDVIEKGSGWPTHLPALLGPALAAMLVTAWLSGREGLADLLSRMGRWRLPLRWWVATLSPLGFLSAAVAIAAATGDVPSWGAFGRYSGLPALGLLAVSVVVIVGALGEETGWRGFALPVLQRRYGPLVAALLLSPLWAVWHLPFFLTVASYRGFPPAGYVGFLFSLACGSIVLTWLYNGSGESIFACAVWHGLFNMATATAAGDGTVAAVTSTLVIGQAVVLVALEVRAVRHGDGSVLGGRSGSRPASQDASVRSGWSGLMPRGQGSG
jgi:CAAX protease family protein